ncbi:MAG: phosphopentomutase [Candidatus Lightella neohaematopini]|nr:phosphopentomutase [Candidatus Lightella neohaematopini]
MKRLFLIIIDSLGIGFANDASKFGDIGANTLGHIAEHYYYNKHKILKIPNLSSLGLAKTIQYATNYYPIGMNLKTNIIGGYAYASSLSSGKDTISGHWEIAGILVPSWHYFSKLNDSIPNKLLNLICEINNLSGFLGNCHASGTEIIKKFGEEHIVTGKPIIYTSADSVCQVACHENIFGLSNLYNLCVSIRNILNSSNYYSIGRVIARPFIGNNANNFVRTKNRCDLSLAPPSITVFQKLIKEKNGTVVSIGKIADIYAHVGINKHIKAYGINNLFNTMISEISVAKNNTIVFTNFVDFDELYGHRRDVIGYALALELFDYRLSEIISKMKNNDLLIITADHGCDPTWNGTDHTREFVPILIYGPKIKPRYYGYRNSFADIGQTIVKYFDLSPMNYGISIL